MLGTPGVSPCCCKCYEHAHTLTILSAVTAQDFVYRTTQGVHMIFIGIVLLIIGFVAPIPIFWTIGIILLIIGIVLELMGMAGHAVAGRRHYY